MSKLNFTKSARKAYPGCGIVKGESFWWWEPFRLPIRRSKTKPRPSQLITADKPHRAAQASEALGDLAEAVSAGRCSKDDVTSELDNIAEQVREIAEEYRESATNIRHSFSESNTADECDEKADNLDAWAEELDDAKSEIENVDTDGTEEEQLAAKAKEDANTDAVGGDEDLPESVRGEIVSHINDANNNPL